MDTTQIKAELDRNLKKLSGLREEVKLKLHLASLDAKQEWDEKLSPKVIEMEGMAKNITEQSKISMNDLITKVEQFLVRLKKTEKH
jgi:hypothetical protein